MNVMDKKGFYLLQVLDGFFFNGVSDYLNLEFVWVVLLKLKFEIMKVS